MDVSDNNSDDDVLKLKRKNCLKNICNKNLKRKTVKKSLKVIISYEVLCKILTF